ncbi:WD40 repeat domain-containing serine/threonine-protein kinase [Nonomuraea sp. NPDC005983]|uniref:WD40 repeat domain-containing serine/threonine-protein kinase n=1 Tax=Nonomuraea sp. NPDC005983 TaxID=3155595 RepID=UPI0033B65B96
MTTRLVPGDPEQLGGYWLAGRLGAGGRSVVYEAYDDDGDRYAVKVPRGEITLTEAAGWVTSPHLARVLASGRDEGVPYVVSEFIEGFDLRHAVARRGPYPGDELTALAGALASALAALHEAGLSHRDLKPENVLLAADGAKVVDCGATGSVDGTRTYVAPEVFTGQQPGPAADVFAWGAVVLYAATGRDPFTGESLGGLMHRLLTAEPDLDPLPPALRPLVAQALAKAPADRPTSDALSQQISPAPALPIDGLCCPRPLGEVAEAAYATLTPRQQEELPGLLLRMYGGETPHDDEHGVLARLTEAGLLVRRSVRVAPTQTEIGKLVAVSDDGIAPASAALFRAWPRLRGWVADEREGLAVYRELREAAHRWAAHRADHRTDHLGPAPHAPARRWTPRALGRRWTARRRERALLYRGRTLETAVGWAATRRRHLRLDPLERDFLDAGAALVARRPARAPVVALIAALVAVAVTMSAVAFRGHGDLGDQLTRTNARLVAARAEALRTKDPQAAMRLSVAAWKLSPVFEARAALQASLVQPELGVFTDSAATPQADYRLTDDTLTRWVDGTITTWDVRTGRQTSTRPLPQGTTALSDDAKHAETQDGRQVTVTTAQPATDAAFLLTSGNRTTLYAAGRQVFQVTDSRAALSRDGRRAATSDLTGRVEVWDVRARAKVRTVRVAPPSGEDAAAPALAFTSDGGVLAIGGRDGTTLVTEPVTEGAVKRIDTKGPADTPVFSPDGRLLAVPAAGTVGLWQVADQRLLGTFPLRDPAHGYAFSSDGRAFRYLSGHGSVVSLDVSKLSTGLPTSPSTGLPTGQEEETRAAALSTDGRVVADEVGGAIRLTDAVRRRPLGRIAATGELAMNRTGTLVAVAGDPVTIWDVATGRRLAVIDAGGDVPAVALSPDGGTLATARGRTLETWDVARARRIRSYEGMGDLAMAFSPDGRTLAVGAKLLDLATGSSTPLNAPGPTALAFAPDGRTLASGLTDGGVQLWNVAEQTRRGSFTAGSEPVRELRFSPDGRTLAVDGERIALWDTATLREVGQVPVGPHTAGLAFSEDGTRLRGVERDGTLRESPVDPSLAAAEVCARAGGPLSQDEWDRLIPETGYRKVC